jgi:hypothetical protein
VVDLIDFFPRPRNATAVVKSGVKLPYREIIKVQEELKKWLVRRVECIRGAMSLGIPLHRLLSGVAVSN